MAGPHDLGRAGRHERSEVWRELGVVGFVVLVVVYLAVVQGAGQLLTLGQDVDPGRPTTVEELWRSLSVPVGLSLLLVLGAVSWPNRRSNNATWSPRTGSRPTSRTAAIPVQAAPSQPAAYVTYRPGRRPEGWDHRSLSHLGMRRSG